MIRDLRLSEYAPSRVMRSVPRADGVLGPRAAWLARVVEEGYIERNHGYLCRDLWDPQERVRHSCAEDRRRALMEPDPRPRRKYG